MEEHLKNTKNGLPTTDWQAQLQPCDERRQLAILSDKEATIAFAIEHFIAIANASIEQRGSFAVALSGGTTPKALFQGLSSQPHRHRIDWKKCKLFWSDERAVDPTSPESNYHMAMEAGLKEMGIPVENVFRMVAESDIEENALRYELTIKKELPHGQFDLVMLGMGDDGHTASLFPWTDGLHVEDRLAIANYIPEKKIWRMTLTFNCINAARHSVVYVIGEGKATILKKVLSLPYTPDDLPAQRVGTSTHPAVWIADEAAASLIK